MVAVDGFLFRMLFIEHSKLLFGYSGMKNKPDLRGVSLNPEKAQFLEIRLGLVLRRESLASRNATL